MFEVWWKITKEMNMKKFLTSLIFFVPSIVYGQWIELSCIDPRDNFTVNFSFNESLQKVRIENDKSIVPGNIDKFNISFNDRIYFTSIKRSTGVMIIQNTQTGNLLSPYQCSPSKQKF
jgi:hypothetical protein